MRLTKKLLMLFLLLSASGFSLKADEKFTIDQVVSFAMAKASGNVEQIDGKSIKFSSVRTPNIFYIVPEQHQSNIEKLIPVATKLLLSKDLI